MWTRLTNLRRSGTAVYQSQNHYVLNNAYVHMLTNKHETFRNSNLTITKSTPTVLIHKKTHLQYKVLPHSLHSTEAYNLSFLNGTATNLHGHRDR